jgi:uncharacterized membrane protein
VLVMSKTRLEAFSDGVIAVAITLLALDLHVPDPAGPGTLAHRLAEQWPNYAAYMVSFLTIGIIWINHHAMLRRLVGVDHAILLLNLVLLLTIVVLPFSTALMAEYLRASHGQNLAAGVWSLLIPRDGPGVLCYAVSPADRQRATLAGGLDARGT